ncbi:MAG TPA: hypothetical protein VHM25_18905 [Polyangiaceae bacterium]|jgi:hypothetical protein|nr:hypothetical protein [Polyangiaceae bacterium]
MTIAVGGSGKASVTGVASAATSSTTTSATGSTFVIPAVIDFSTSFGVVDDNMGNTFTQVGSEIVFNASGGRARLYQCVNGAGGAGHIATIRTAAASDIGGALIEITGGATVTPLDQNGGRNDTASPFTLAAGLTTTQANELLLSFLAGNSGSNPATHAESGIGSMTIQQQETNGATRWPWAVATKVVSATGTFNPSWTESGASNSAVFLATFKEAAAAGSTAVQSLMLLGLGA